MNWTDNEIHTMIKDGISLTAFLKAKKVSPTGKPRDILRQDLARLGYASVNLLKNIRRRKWTKIEIENAARESHGLVDCWRILTGLKHKTGGAISRLKNMINEYGIDISHFSSLHHIRTRLGTKKFHKDTYSDNDIFKKNTKATSRTVFDRYTIINPPICCSRCQLKDWLNEPISLQLDHKSGDRSDCRLINLRWLCPNCHSQTPTYSRGHKISKVKWPTDHELLAMNDKMSGAEIARRLKTNPVYVAKKLRIARSRLSHNSMMIGSLAGS